MFLSGSTRCYLSQLNLAKKQQCGTKSLKISLKKVYCGTQSAFLIYFCLFNDTVIGSNYIASNCRTIDCSSLQNSASVSPVFALIPSHFQRECSSSGTFVHT
jgi:hypothetical protein